MLLIPNLSEFIQASVAGVPVLFLVLVVVEFIKDAGLENPKAKRLTAWGAGMLLGGLYQVAAMGVPTNLMGWFVVGAYGLVIGVSASKLYETAGKLITKALQGLANDEPTG